MASSFDSTSHRLAVQVHTGGKVFPGNDRAGQQPRIEASRPESRLEGWFLPAQGTEVHGMRVLLGKEAVVVKRKQIRPDVLRLHPEHPEALLSGFKAEFNLRAGINEVKLQFKDAGQQWHDLGSWQIRLPRLWRLKSHWAQRNTGDAYEQWLRDYQTPTPAELDRMRTEAGKMVKPPLISVILTLRDRSTADFRNTVESIRAQVYPSWELCIVHDAPLGEERVVLIEKWVQHGNRLKLCKLDDFEKPGLANVLEAAAGEHITFLSEGDALVPHALLHVATEITRHPDVELLYSDEDEVDAQGKHHAPHFKGGWDQELLLYRNWVGQMLVFRTSSLQKLGALNPQSGTNLEWVLLLKASAQIPRAHIRHLPQVLFHRHNHPSSTEAPKEKTARSATDLPSPAPLVSIIVPTRNRAALLRVAMDSLFAKTQQPPYEIVVVDHASDEADSLAYLKELAQAHENVRVIRADGPFNWSRLNNLGASEAKGDILLFLNNDVEIIETDWLRELASQAWRSDVGAVGACLLYPDGTIQHAGIVLGMTGLAGHVFRTMKPDAEAMGWTPRLPREVTAVTGACLAVRRSLFQEVGGFDQENLPVSYNDVDFCLKLRARGLRNIYTPFAKLIHHESVSRRESEQESTRKAAASEEARIVLQRWPEEFRSDALYSPLLSSDHEIPNLAFPPPHLTVHAGEFTLPGK